MTFTHAMLLAVLSFLGLTIMSVSGLEVAGDALIPRLEPCGSPSSNCDACGAGFQACGQNACFNAMAGEICCDAASNWVCPPGNLCSDVRGQCLQGSAPAPEPSTTLTMSTTMTTTSTATSTMPGVATSVPADTYGPVVPSSAPLLPSSAPAPPSSAVAPPSPPSVPVTDTIVSSAPNSTCAPTIQTTSVLSNTTWTTSTELSTIANTTVPLVTLSSSSAAPTLPHASTSTTILTPVSIATDTPAATSSAAPTAAASTIYVELGFWKVVGLIGLTVSALVYQT